MSLMDVVFCQIEVSAMGRSLAQSSPTDCGVPFYVKYKPQKWGGHDPPWAVAPGMGWGEPPSQKNSQLIVRVRS